MGFGPFSSDSSATTTHVTVSDQGQYNKNSPVLQGSAKGTIGKGSQYAESGSLQIGSKAKLNTALLAGANLKGYKGDITITDNGGAQTADALNKVLDAFTSTRADTSSAAPSSITVLPAPVSPLKKYWPALLLAPVLLWFLFRKK